MARPITDTITLTGLERRVLDRALITLDTAARDRLHALLSSGRSLQADEEPGEADAYDPLLSAAFLATMAVARRVQRQLESDEFADEGTQTELVLIRGEAAVLAQALMRALLDPRQQADDARTLARYDGDPEARQAAKGEIDTERRCSRQLAGRLSDL